MHSFMGLKFLHKCCLTMHMFCNLLFLLPTCLGTVVSVYADFLFIFSYMFGVFAFQNNF